MKAGVFRAFGEIARRLFMQRGQARSLLQPPMQLDKLGVERGFSVGHEDRRAATQSWKAWVGLSMTAEKTPPAKPGA